MSRRRPARAPLSPTERVAAERLALHGLRHLRVDAQELLVLGAVEQDLRDLRISVTAGLCGYPAAQERWGATSARAIELARDRVAHLVDGALWCVVVHASPAPQFEPMFRSIWGVGGDGVGLAWSPSSGVDPSIPVRRWPDPQLELDLDDEV